MGRLVGVVLGALLCLAVCVGEPMRTAPVWLGMAVPRGDLAQLDRVSSLTTADPSVFSVFVKPDSDFDADNLRAIAARGMTPFITLEPWSWQTEFGTTDVPEYALSTVVAGNHDRQLRRIAAAVADYDGAVYLRFAHEMNGHWYPWAVGQNGNTATDYVDAWAHVHRLFDDAGAAAAQWVWAPNVLGSVRGTVDIATAYPGDDLVDFVGLTGYGREHDTADHTFQGSLTALREITDKPVLLAETGSAGSRTPGWIRSLATLLEQNPQVRGFVWFNTSPETTGATGDYRIDDKPAVVTAFNDLLAATGVGMG